MFISAGNCSSLYARFWQKSLAEMRVLACFFQWDHCSYYFIPFNCLTHSHTQSHRLSCAPQAIWRAWNTHTDTQNHSDVFDHVALCQFKLEHHTPMWIITHID